MAAQQTAVETDWPVEAAHRPRDEPLLPGDDVARLGKAIYQREIRSLVEADHHGEYVSIDVESGCWEVADELLTAGDKLRANHPGVVNVWSERVGFPAVLSFGGRARRNAE